ncbi:adenylate/guanylate cyclase domain-containing protein [Bradyrhizobium sp. Pha-3]|uniref:adenylate/guanylate cyclase domain-containing protein n=1 Tax=Bradyrhizobium sp. Pha-3 TaxID=208375 RepID=UPI0035D4B6B1
MSGSRVERRLVAVLAADVAGYSRLMGLDEVGTLEALKSHRRDIVDPAIKAHYGRIVKTTGDGMLVEFASAVDAVTCAVSVQERMAERNAASSGPHIAFRIGINIGDIIIEGDDIFGDGVNIAARIEGECKPGGVSLSASAFEQVRGKTGFSFEDLGEKSLKNIDRPVRIYATHSLKAPASGLAASQIAQPKAAPPIPERPSIAVLPFQNMSGDPDQEYFADGIVEDIITGLSHFKSLFVIARNSSFTYKGKAVDIKQVGRELGVRYVLEGSVRKGSGRVRITGQLIDATNGAHLWADKFDGAMADVFELQDEITEKVVSSIAPALELAEIERAGHQPAALHSYDLFLKGMAFYYRRTGPDFTQAYAIFKQALEIDPSYAAAHAMLAFSGLAFQAFTGVKLSVDRLQEALESAEAARKLDEADAFVQAAAGHVLVYLGQKYDLGLSLVDRAVKLNPNLAPAWYSRGAVTLMCDQPEEAIKSFNHVMRLSPRDPLLVRVWYMTSWAYFSQNDYANGLRVADQALQRAPDVHSLAAFTANAIRDEKPLEARQAAQRLLEFQPDFRASHAHYLFPIRSLLVREGIQGALRDAGIPD